MSKSKIYALALTLIMLWGLPLVFLCLFVYLLILTNPYSDSLFYYIDKQIELFTLAKRSKSIGQVAEKISKIEQIEQIEQNVGQNYIRDSDFCKGVLKSGKRCRNEPHESGYCKRHTKQNKI